MGSPEGTFDTKLHEAVRCDDLEEVKVALGQGYDPNLIGLFQWSSLHEAAYNGNLEILKLLLEKKGDPNKPDQIQQKTAMHYATEQGHIECLKQLVATGGRYDLRDDSGRDCLDRATPAGRKILERLKVRDIMLKPSEGEPDICMPVQSTDDQSSLSGSLSSSRRSSEYQKPALGYLHLSVEYHSSKSTIKIRIWQITDLFLPPSNTSMIHSIYVKSYLAPDKKKDTKRKTEEIKVENSEGHVHWKKQKKSNTQVVFSPSSFKFTRALEYSGVKPEMIKEKHLSIEVCITQKYSHRSFLIGMVNMSLKSAVKKIVKEKIPLIPCMNHTIPSTMKVYSASDLNIVDSNVFYSNPNFRMSIPEDFDRSSTTAFSNPNLQSDKYSPTAEVDMNHEFRTIPNVPKLDLNQALDESGYSSEIHVSVTGDLESPDSDSPRSLKFLGKSSKPGSSDEIKIKNINVLESVKEQGAGVTSYHRGIPVTDLDEEEEEIEVISTEPLTQLGKKSQGPESDQPHSRPETPTWDYYDMPKEVLTEVTPSSPWKGGAAPVVLPMAMTMHSHQGNGGDISKEGKSDKARKKSGKKNVSPKPGRPVPLVPEIIITDVEHVLDVRHNEKKVMTEVPSIKIEKPVPVKSVSVNMETKSVISSERSGKESKSKVTRVTSPDEHTIAIGSVEAVEKTTALESDQKQSTEKTGRHSSLRAKLKKLRIGKGSVSKSDSKKATEEVSGTLEKKPHLPGVAVRVADTIDLTTLPDPRSRKDSEVSSNASFVVDMENSSFVSSDSHIVELDNDVSITELPEGSQLFSRMTESSFRMDDVESGLESYELPERVLPTKYMIPMQVYMDDDTSCDESLADDRLTEL